MDALVFTCDDYKVTISTDSIEYAWGRFERRVKDAAMNYCDYYSSRDGFLSILMPKNEAMGLQELNNEEIQSQWLQLWPVLFETCKYQFAVEFKNLYTTSDKRFIPRVRHQMKGVGSSFNFYPSGEHSGILVGVIDFLNSPGKFNFSFEYTNEEELLVREYLELYVASPKLDTKNDLNQIIALINQEYENYVFDYLTLTFNSFSLCKSERNNNIIWLSIFKNVVDEYFRNVRYIMSRPNNKPVRKTYHARPDRIRRWNIREEERYKDMGNDADKHFFRYDQIENTTNTRENRFVKYSLHILGKKFQEIFNEVSTLYKDMDADEQKDLALYHQQFRQLYSSSFFRKVGEFEGFRQESVILQQRTGYSKIYKSWLMLKSSLDLIDGKTDIGMKKIWELYEIWCFLVMKRLIVKVLNLDTSSLNEHIREDKSQMLNTIVKSDMTHIVEFDNVENGDLIRLEYQHTYNRKSEGIKTTTTEQRPDIVVTITKPDGFVLTYLYDAKYRVQDDVMEGDLDDGVDIDIADYPLPDAINQMHRYRDAIYYAMNEDKRPQGKEIIGGYILFPGRAEGDKIENRYFYQSIKRVNIGAFPLLPAVDSQDNEIVQCDLLEKHLREILCENSAYEQIKDSIPQKGLEYNFRPSDGECLVLVGYAKKKDKDKFLEQRIYYTRAEFEKGSMRLQPGFEWTKYLLLHDATNAERKLYLLNEKGPRIASLEALQEKGFSPSHGNWFWVFDIMEDTECVEINSGVKLPNVKAKYEPYFMKLKDVMMRE